MVVVNFWGTIRPDVDIEFLISSLGVDHARVVGESEGTQPEGVQLEQIREMHNSDLIMSLMVSQITSIAIVYSIVCCGVDQRKHQTGEFPAQRASNTENVSIWWHHGLCRYCITVISYECHDSSYHWQLDSLFNSLIRLTSKVCVTGYLWGESTSDHVHAIMRKSLYRLHVYDDSLPAGSMD